MKLAEWQASRKNVASAAELMDGAVFKAMLEVLLAEHPVNHGLPKMSTNNYTVSADDRSYQLGLEHGAQYLLNVMQQLGKFPPKPPKEVQATFSPPQE